MIRSLSILVSCLLLSVALGWAYALGQTARSEESIFSTSIEARIQPMPSTVESIVGFGDSITVGAGISEEDRWLNAVAAELGGATVNNQGRSGSVLQDSPDASGKPRRANGKKRFLKALTGENFAEIAIIAYGFNDARYVASPVGFNVFSFLKDYREILQGLLAHDYVPERIVVVSPYYIDDIGLGRGSRGFAGQTRAEFEAYVTASRNVAEEFGTYWADAYSPMRQAVGRGEKIFRRDNIHPNARGHEIIKAAVLAATRQP